MMQAPQPASVMFNNLIQSYLICSLNNLNILSYLNSQGFTTLEELLEKFTISETLLSYLLKLSEYYGLISVEHDTIRLSEHGREAYKMVGFFTWAIGGYGQLLGSLDKFCGKKQEQKSNFIKGDQVAKGSDECYKHLMQPILHKALKSIPFSRVADLGCGNAGKLIEFARLNPDFIGIGVDINAGAIELASQNVKENHLEDRIKLYCGNALDTLNSHLRFPEVETVTCFMMMHDFFNVPGLSDQLFDKLKTTFPNVKYFVIGDTIASSNSEIQRAYSLPIFTLGFELVHQFMNVKLFELDYYLDVFRKAGLSIEQTIPFGVPNTYLFVLRV